MFNVSISIDNASVSSTANSMEDVWALMVPALMAAGFDLEVQIIYSLHDFVEKSGEFYVTSKVDFDNIMAGARRDGFEEGVRYAKSSSEECEGQSFCGND
jgi:hypothetical protein